MYKIIVTEPAQKDLKNAVSYISNELKNNQAAGNLIDLVEETVNSLRDMPERYAVVDDDVLAREGFRFITVKTIYCFTSLARKQKLLLLSVSSMQEEIG